MIGRAPGLEETAFREIAKVYDSIVFVREDSRKEVQALHGIAIRKEERESVLEVRESPIAVFT